MPIKERPPTKAELARFHGSNGRRRANTEMQILSGVRDWLNTVPGVSCWRHNVGSREYRREDGRAGLVRFGTPGESDLMGICCGVFLAVEVKAVGKKPSVIQDAWLNFIRKEGGIAFWCDSLEGCQQQLREEFERRGWLWRTSWET